MITGDINEAIQDLNLVVPHETFYILENFLMETMGYKKITEACHPAMVSVVEHFGKYAFQSRWVTLACPKTHMHVLHLILHAPTTADMVYLTTGGVTCFYPQWMRQQISIHSHTGDLVPWDNKLGCAGEIHSSLRVESNMDFLQGPCGNRCPTLWHHISDKYLRQSVDWDMTDSVTHTFYDINVEWRLNTYCLNTACRFCRSIMGSNLENAGAANRADVKYIPQEIKCRRPRFSQVFQVIDGVKKTTLNNLYVHYWVKQREFNALTSPRQHLHHTFTSLPHFEYKLDNLYTIYFEKPENHSTTNHLLEHMACMSGMSTSIKGTVLVVKQMLSTDSPVVNMDKDDMLLTNMMLGW
ncbi:uncharacterized protein F5147DRAFT_659399 [Suillus discolor]|uniref:Uncharacterized protein n=1 Tax=Suillus discolor TaxID=1912936 RepID=A0A9P7JLD6_9AGAM|nr:uncharacterized protein F5147DRAFT_659399 [Suillus discolor]KAG2085769.1 hypothetical protein F5147DRAFT_659399 [Suillus discolor]